MLISIIIPCFNSGLFLLEAIDSCFKSSFKDYELVIINDGSTDDITLKILDNLNSNSKFKIFNKSNGGPASARNLGIKKCCGDFIFFLDSDNKIRPDYLIKAIKVLESNPSAGVVYSLPVFFGETDSSLLRFKPHQFSLNSILAGNYIDMCTLVRRAVFDEIGGFDEHSDLIGWEDWDLWIRVAQTQWLFHYLDEELFDYRVRKDSLMGQGVELKKEKMLRYLGSKHGFIFHQKYRQYFRVVENIQRNPFSYFLRILIYKYILRKPLIN
ncbi:glycosyltransferase family 2 protein [Algoriphagus sp. NBT04N3]|uniref:glycosyltransferase family 2 protein n=1 Tax=Algoriphagus sp. NBT04N3 TaxID=2705473 RepID=UPI001C6297C3|nr:glycosyltransferase family A protein [Algoriphagus sp. NBT04N3]QYH38005.1 glycosyltransferase family 2 protein [Algoriphagus sp. NBT04N3]